MDTDHQAFLCAQNGCEDMPELAELFPHDRIGHSIINALKREGITSRAQLEALSDWDLSRIRAIGPSSFKIIRSSVPRRAPSSE